MFGPAPADYQPTEAELDLRARLVPTDDQLGAVFTYLGHRPGRVDYAHAALALPGKARGIWTLGQPVEAVPGVFDTREAAVEAADRWLGVRDGQVAYVCIWTNGDHAVFEGFRP